MDPFLAIVLGSVALALGAFIVIGILNTPGGGSEQLGWHTTHEHDRTAAVREAEDLEQMLEAANAHRRARGEAELTLEGIAHADSPAPAPLAYEDEDVRRGPM
jgi:hypothetical protein